MPRGGVLRSADSAEESKANELGGDSNQEGKRKQGTVRVIGLSASPLIAESLKVGLSSNQVEVRPVEPELSRDPFELSLVVYEPAAGDAETVTELLTSPRMQDVPILFIGSPESELVRLRHNVEELPQDISVGEVTRLVRELLFDEPGVPPAPPSGPSTPFSVLPRRSDRPVSRPPSSLRSSPASLLPNPAQQSSRPPRRVTPSMAPLAMGPKLIDEVNAGPSELSERLLTLLADAERRVEQELPIGASLGAVNGGAEKLTVQLSPDIQAALQAPIGIYRSEVSGAATGLFPTNTKTAAQTQQGSFPSAEEGTGEGTHERRSPSELTSAEASPASPRTSPSRSPEKNVVDDEPSSYEPHSSHPAPSAPSIEAAARLALGQRTPLPPPEPSKPDTLGTPLPPAPALPHDAWVESTVSRSLASRPEPAGPHGERSIPHTSRSAKERQTNEGSANDRRVNEGSVNEKRADEVSSQERITGPPESSPPSNRRSATDAPDDSRVSTVPPSNTRSPDSDKLGSTTTVGLAYERLAAWGTRGPDEPTNPPPRRKDLEPEIESMPAAAARSREEPSESEIPPLQAGDSVRVLANAIRSRFSGAIAFESDAGMRRVVMRDGDFVTAASGVSHESLVAYLARTGILASDVQSQLGHRLANFGRHAGAALIAGGHLPQDQLWPVLRAHAEFVVGQVVAMTHGIAALESSIPERLQSEPSVFGGATGSEVLVEILRRVVEPAVAIERLGGGRVRLGEGTHVRLLDECALSDAERQAVQLALRYPLDDALSRAPTPEFPCVLYGLSTLSVLRIEQRPAADAEQHAERRLDHLDREALQKAIEVRRALVDNGDYFALLGVPRSATGYDIRRAFLELRKTFEPSEALSSSMLHLRDDVELITEVLEEAYDILRDPERRERYRRALEALPN